MASSTEVRISRLRLSARIAAWAIMLIATRSASAQQLIHVPADMGLQAALDSVSDGGVVEIATGTYSAPANAFQISDKSKGFTVRAADGASVVLTGNDTNRILLFINSNVSLGRPVVFENLTFTHGYSATNGQAGGVTVQRAHATFVNCTFSNNNGEAPGLSGTGGGGTLVGVGSTVFFFDSKWMDNRNKNAGAAIDIGGGSEAFIHNSDFQRNRTNFSGHHEFAAGGAIHIGDSKVRISNSYFKQNEAGYVGGAVYVIGTWADPVSTPAAELTITNSYFEGNKAIRDVGQQGTTLPTEGGAVHGEDQSTTRIFNSRFKNNEADTGGAVNAFRSEMEVYSSIFVGNTTAGTPSAPKFGGTFNVISNDGNDFTTNYGAINRRSVSLIVHDSYVEGNHSVIPTTAGCLLAGGDEQRMYGQNGVTQMGTLTDNRANVDIQRTFFYDCDSKGTDGGIGGAIQMGLTNFTLADSVIVKSNSYRGGAFAALNESLVNITNTTMADNVGVKGGAIFGQGSTINVSGSRFFRNSASTGAAEGSVMYTEPNFGAHKKVDGLFSGNTISGNTGAIELHENDNNTSATDYNAMQYNANVILGATTTIYYNWVVDPGKTVAGLNSVNIPANGGRPVTDKSPASNNTVPGSAPAAGQILVVPPGILSVGAVNETGPFPVYAGFVWAGPSSVTLNGVTKNGGNGVATVSSSGTQQLLGTGVTASDAAVDLTNPSITLGVSPTTIAQGATATLSWNATADNLIEVATDHGVGSSSLASSNASVSPSATSVYRSLAFDEAGGSTASASLAVTVPAPTVTFSASNSFLTQGQSATLTWTATAGSTVTFNGTPVATSSSLQVTPGGTTTYVVSATNGYGTTSKTVIVTVNNAAGVALAQPTITAPSAGQSVGVSAVTFSWNSVPGAAGYALSVWDAPTGTPVFLGSLSGGSSTSTVVSLPTGSYRFGVRACNASGYTNATCGLYSAVLFSIAPISPSGTPTLTSPTAGAVLTGSTVTFAWTAVTGNPALSFLKYEVLVRNTGTGKTVLQTSELAPSQTTIYSLGTGSYEAKVRACQAGCGPYSSPVAFSVSLPAVPTAAPTIVDCPVTGGNSVTCTWTSVPRADLYQIDVVQPNSGPGGGALTVAARQVGSTSVTFSVPSGNANVVVVGCNGDGCGPQSPALAINPAGPNPSLPAIGTPKLGSVVSGPYVLFTWSRVPGDTGSNVTYRLYVRDFARQETALDVLTTSNFYGAYLTAEGTRYDSLIIVNPDSTGAGTAGPATGFNVAGSSSTAPTMVAPMHNSTVHAGNIYLGWTPVLGATLYEYYVASGSNVVTGVTPGLLVQVPLAPTGQVWNGIARACPAGATCVAGSDAGWGPWSNSPGGPGITQFTVIP